MKSIIIAILCLSLSCSIAYAQDQKVDSVLTKWTTYFNKKEYQKAYSLYTPFYKQKVTLEWLTERMKQTFGMMGKLKSIKLISHKGDVFKYSFYAQKNDIEADVSVVLNKDYQISYLVFDSIGGAGDPPTAQKRR